MSTDAFRADLLQRIATPYRLPPADRAIIHCSLNDFLPPVVYPGLAAVTPDDSLSLEFSRRVRSIYEDYTDLIEPNGTSECWLDVTGSTRLSGSAESLADRIRERVRNELGITVSVGVSWNKVFARLGGGMKKPDATTMITRENFHDRVWPLPIEALLPDGRGTSTKLRGIGIDTVGRLARSEPAFLRGFLGKCGEPLWYFANGHDAAPIEPVRIEMLVKEVGNSTPPPREPVSIDGIHRRFGHYPVQLPLVLRSRVLNGNPGEENLFYPYARYSTT